MNVAGTYDEYGFVAEFYDRVTVYSRRQDIQFYVDLAKECGGPVLELGCGTGRVMIPILREGIETVGLDNSESMLRVCQEKLCLETPELRKRAQIYHGDIRFFNLGRTFKLLTTPFRVYQHLTTVDDQLHCLECINQHLEPGGRFILDLFNPYLPRLYDDRYLEEVDEEEPFTMPDGRRVVRKNRIVARDLNEQVLTVELIYYVTYSNGREERLIHAFKMRYFFRFEIEHLLARSGFEIEQRYSDYDKSPIGSKNPGELLFVARKK